MRSKSSFKKFFLNEIEKLGTKKFKKETKKESDVVMVLTTGEVGTTKERQTERKKERT